MNRIRLYLLLGTATLGGYGYLIWAYASHANYNNPTPCLFKNITGIACPSCGSTRSLISIINGNFTDAFFINPLGYVIAIILLALPLWLLYDVILKNDTLYRNYKKFEAVLQIKWLAGILVLLILINWIWNIMKGL